MAVARRKLQQNFSRAAEQYDARAEFQHTETRRVLDAALMIFPETATIADIGCGTGYFAAVAEAKRSNWQVMGIDVALGMCAVAKRRCTVIAGDATYLPLADASIDAAVSSLCYQWVENQSAAFTELARVLKPGARAVIASLGSTTLQELRNCASDAELLLGLLPMRNFKACKAAFHQAGLEISFAEKRMVTEYYPDVNRLFDSMRMIGAGNNFHEVQRLFIGPKRWAKMIAAYEKLRTPKGIPASWEHHFFILHKPQ